MSAFISLEDYALSRLVSESTLNVLPLFDENLKDFDGLVSYICNEYLTYINAVKTSMDDKLKRLVEQIDILETKIASALAMSEQERRAIVSAEIEENRKIMACLIKDKEDYLKYLQDALTDARKERDSLPEEAIAAFVKIHFADALKSHTGTLKLLKDQERALLSTDTVKQMPSDKFQDIALRRISTFKRELSEADKERVETEAVLAQLDKKIAEITTLTSKK